MAAFLPFIYQITVQCGKKWSQELRFPLFSLLQCDADLGIIFPLFIYTTKTSTFFSHGAVATTVYV